MNKTFLYHAQASALGGFVTVPDAKVIETVAGVSLPITGGHQKVPIMSGYMFDTPKITIAGGFSEVLGRQTDGSYNTDVSCVVSGLVVADIQTGEEIINAGSIEMSISTSHPGDDSETVVKITGAFHNLVIKGEPVGVVFDSWLNDAPTYTKFDQQFGNSPNVCKCNRPGLMRCSLIKQITHSLAQPGNDQRKIKVPNFGTIYLGEVHLKDNTRRVTMMRLQLGSPVVGSVSICGGEGNGATVP